jgi:UDP-glucose 6-dehydrogenase
MNSNREPIGVIGTGYVGLVTAAGFAELGSEVYCIDIDAAKIEGLQRGRVPIYEPGLEELLARHRERLHFSTDLADALEHARLLFVAVGTPPTYSGDADLSAVDAVVEAMPPSDRHALIMKSTVPVGTGERVKRMLAEQSKGFSYVSCPEFLKEGSAIADFLHPDRVVVGDDGDWAGDAVVELYAPLDAPLVRTDIRSAEMVKLASNAFLATKISFINEIANVCEETGADVVEVARGMGFDARIGPKFLQAGIGFGGSCFDPGETVLARWRGQARLVTFASLWELAGGDEEAVAPEDLEVLSWVPGEAEPEYMPVSVLTRTEYDGEMVELRTKMGRRVRTTVDHPFIVGDGRDGAVLTHKLAGDLGADDWVPLALGGPPGFEPAHYSLAGVLEERAVEPAPAS